MAMFPTHSYRQPGITSADVVRLIILAAPVAVLVLLLRKPHLDPSLQAPGLHFVIVTLAAGMAALLGALVLLVAERLREPRAFSLGLAFCAIAGFFFIHGLLTPGFVIKHPSHGIGWAPLAGLLTASRATPSRLEARILAVTDVYDAMRSGRSSPHEAHPPPGLAPKFLILPDVEQVSQTVAHEIDAQHDQHDR